MEASRECARWNKQLLAIDSPEKQNVIKKLIPEDRNMYFWLGANNKDNYSGDFNIFFWLATGKQFLYANWDSYSPREIQNRHCVLIWMHNKKWVNYVCGAKHGFICEEKQLLESSNKNQNNASDIVQTFINDFSLKFQSLLKDNIAQLSEQLENIRQVAKETSFEVEKLTNITQTAVKEILNKQEISTKELDHEIIKQGNDLSDQLKRSVDEINSKFSEKQNVIQNEIF